MSFHCATIWGVELSPFTLKLQACLDYKGIRYKRLPHHGSYAENIKTLLRLEYLKQRKLIVKHPDMDLTLDEYPAVPFYSENGIDFQYDSSAIARYLDEKEATNSDSAKQETLNKRKKLFPQEPIFNFIAHLIDEAFDEFGLYMVHHMRWVGSARSNNMGDLLAKEFRKALPPGGPSLLSKSFPKRQVRRCPYLFSIAPNNYRSGMPKALTPPSRKGFPETHTLLYESWIQYLKGMEEILSKQDYLLGDTFTIADASAYGQLAMNLVDPEAAELLENRAPRTFSWLNQIYRHQHTIREDQREESSANMELYLSTELKPLLNTIMSTFSTLMVQNEKAFQIAQNSGITTFNEEAFNEGCALYNGKLRGYPFRSVVKTFQVKVWRDLCAHWQRLSTEEKSYIADYVNMTELFDIKPE